MKLLTKFCKKQIYMSLSESLRFTFINLTKQSTKTMWKPILYLGIPISKE